MLHGGKEGGRGEREREISKQGINSVQVNLNSGTTNLHQRLSQTSDERFESNLVDVLLSNPSSTNP